MRSPSPALFLALPALLTFSGCGYVHVGRLPEPVATTTVIGDDTLMKENSDLRLEKKLLQQELALTRAQGDALRMAIENRTAAGDTAQKLVEKLNESSRELALLRANYAKLQGERDQAIATAAEAYTLKQRLGATEEKLAASLRTYTELQDEIGRLRGDVARTRAENVTLTEQVRVVTAQNENVQAALAQLNTELLAQKDARQLAEQDADILRTELKTVAPNSTVLAHQRTGAAGQVRSLAAEYAAESAALKQQLEALRGNVGALEAERAQLRQQLNLAEAASRAPSPELASMESRLNSALRSESALRDENQQLKAVAGPNALSLREQLNEAQSQAAALVEENARLKSRLAGSRTVVATETPRIELGSDEVRPTVVSTRSTSSVSATLVANVSGASRARIETGGQRVHVVAGGDTLAKISSHYYGTPTRWGDILAANKDVLGENNNLVVGRSLRIP